MLCPPNLKEMRAFWELIQKLHTLRQGSNEPWLIGGDFNDTLFELEKQGGIKKRDNRA